MPPPPLTTGHEPPAPLRPPAVRELLFVERVDTQMNKLVQDAAKGSGGGGALYTRAREVARLVVAILTRSARFYSASSLLPSHTNEFIVALCGVLHTDALLSFRVPQTSTPSPPIASCTSSSLSTLTADSSPSDVVVVTTTRKRKHASSSKSSRSSSFSSSSLSSSPSKASRLKAGESKNITPVRQPKKTIWNSREALILPSDSSDDDDEQLARAETLPIPDPKSAGVQPSSELIDCIDIDDEDDEGDGGDTSIVDLTGQDSQEVS